MYGGMSWPWMLLTGIFWLLILAGLVLLIIWLVNRGRVSIGGAAGDAPIDILRRRYASGEISGEEFQRMKRELQDESP